MREVDTADAVHRCFSQKEFLEMPYINQRKEVN